MHLLAIPLLVQLFAQPRAAMPVLAFPEVGLDDTAAYEGYRTRFFRDVRGNTVQIYLDQQSGRVVALWADAANESIAFTVRGPDEHPAPLAWDDDGATIGTSGGMRTLTFRLAAASTAVRIGSVLMGSMRVERDFQYARRHLGPFGVPAFRLRDLDDLIARLDRLTATERQRHLVLLNARSADELRSRLVPRVTTSATAEQSTVRFSQTSFDGRAHLRLAIAVDRRRAELHVADGVVSIDARDGDSVRFTVNIATNAASLTPLGRAQIFDRDFLRFLADARTRSDSVRAERGVAPLDSTDSVIVARHRWLERQVRSVELLASGEKLMAGLPNFATYFGRDMMMTALMMQPIWTPAMAEHVIAGVLRKVSPDGDVSHEEALGGQAIRESAAEYVALIDRYLALDDSASGPARDSLLRRARGVLRDAPRTRENYHMRDDEFHLPVLTARYLADRRIGAARKRAFLLAAGEARLETLLRELALVAEMTAAYARDPSPGNLVAFPERAPGHWFPGSWRDSNAGYANGRFAMDVNAIWAPSALVAIAEILDALAGLDVAQARLERALPAAGAATLRAYIADRDALWRAVETWNGAIRHFVVRYSPDEIRAHLTRWSGSLPAQERRHWQNVLASTNAARDSLVFLALSLDSAGRPIPVANTDPATALFLRGDTVAGRGGANRPSVLEQVDVFMRPYPVGLFIDRVGPVVANDAYATPEVWEAFRRDAYHSPRVVWGREVNLYLLGLTSHITAARDTAARRDAGHAAYVARLEDALHRTLAAVDASGLGNAELWSYRIEDGRLQPIRYGTSSDVQLWSTTDLAVQYALWRLYGRATP